jgi:antitoxin PrlF
MREWAAKVSNKGRVTLPKAARDALGVGPGDRITFVMGADSVTITRWQSVVQRTAGMMHSDRSYATAEEMRAAVEEAIAKDVLRRMNE